jgi:hypothetical protein
MIFPLQRGKLRSCWQLQLVMVHDEKVERKKEEEIKLLRKKEIEN